MSAQKSNLPKRSHIKKETH